MAAPPDDPNRPPKYLPRIKYQPPDSEPELEDEEDETPEGEDGEIALEGEDAASPAAPKAKSKGEKTDPSASPANPARPGPMNPPRAKARPERSPAATTPSRPKEPARPERPRRERDREAAPAEAKPKRGSPRVRSQIDAASGRPLEATPETETFEGRRRIRMAVGSVAGLAILISMFVLWRSLRSDEEYAPEPEPLPPGQVANANAAREPKRPSPEERKAAADALLVEAQSLERAGKTEEAFAKVEAILTHYTETPTARIATAARDRHRQGLPLFPEGAAVIADRAGGEEGGDENAPAEEGGAEVVAVAPTPAPVTPASPSGLAPEPRRPIEVGLPRANVAARPLPAGFHARPEAGVHASGWPLEIVCERDGASMMLIPGDRFMQGRDDGRPEERPAHTVQLSSFYIDQHEVTAKQFSAFQGGPIANDDRPAAGKTLDEARAYARWAGKAIPTEAQWEMAARTPDGRIHPWGNAPPSWGATRQPKRISRVMSFADDLSPYGVFDLAGNAWEWTNDWFDTKYYGQLKSQTATNPAGPTHGLGRLPEVVIKGGSKDWDGSWRSGMRPDARLPYLGFRCVLNVEGPGASMGQIPQPAPSPDAPAPSAPDNGRPAPAGVPF